MRSQQRSGEQQERQINTREGQHQQNKKAEIWLKGSKVRRRKKQQQSAEMKMIWGPLLPVATASADPLEKQQQPAAAGASSPRSKGGFPMHADKDAPLLL